MRACVVCVHVCGVHVCTVSALYARVCARVCECMRVLSVHMCECMPVCEQSCVVSACVRVCEYCVCILV